MKTILCYGDSNTWGYNPLTKDRYNRDTRWGGVLRNTLGNEYTVIEEGLNGRTTVWDDPFDGIHKNGRTYLIPCLESHKPIDLVVVLLGTNDLKQRFGVGALDIAKGAEVLVRIIQKSDTGPDSNAPKVLLLAPPPTAEFAGTDFAEMFKGAYEKSKNFSSEFQCIADNLACDYMDTAGVIVSSKVDAIHLEAEEHSKLGKAVAVRVKEILEI